MKRAILPLAATIALLVCGCMESANLDIPENYYITMKKADVDSPVELIRFAASIRPHTADLTVEERVAFFEWYLQNRGFNVSFAYSDNFRGSSREHIWLVLKNQTARGHPALKDGVCFGPRASVRWNPEPIES